MISEHVAYSEHVYCVLKVQSLLPKLKPHRNDCVRIEVIALKEFHP